MHNTMMIPLFSALEAPDLTRSVDNRA